MTKPYPSHMANFSRFDKAREIADAIGGPLGEPGMSGPQEKSRRLSFAGMAATLARTIMPDGSKALAPSGAAVVGQEFTPDPVRSGSRRCRC